MDTDVEELSAVSEPRFFKSQAEFRTWLEAHHDSETELLVGFWKVKSGKGGLTYREALDEALCFGWIDGVRRSLGEESHSQRFTPRRRKSYWSDINIKRVGELMKEGKMHAAGIAAFEARDTARSAKYSGEQSQVAFSPEQVKELKANDKAWEFFQSQPPSYRKPATWWVISAKREETRLRRLQTLIKDSEAGLRIALMRRP